MGGYQQGLRAFYELIDNGQLSGRALYSATGNEIQWNCRFWVASVDHLQVENACDGWKRRAVPLPTLGAPKVVDPNLHLKLSECMADIISWALAMPRVERDAILLGEPEIERIKEAKRDAELHGDSAKVFVDMCLRPTAQPGATISKQDLHSRYVSFCKAFGYIPASFTKFNNHLKTFLGRNHVDRSWSPMVNGTRNRISAHWGYLQYVEGSFENVSLSGGDGYQSGSSEPVWACIKSRCCEGGLLEIEEFWNPSPPDDGGGGGGGSDREPPKPSSPDSGLQLPNDRNPLVTGHWSLVTKNVAVLETSNLTATGNSALVSEEAISDTRDWLESCSTQQDFQDLFYNQGDSVVSPQLLNAAVKRLSLERYEQIKQWVKSIKEKDSTKVNRDEAAASSQLPVTSYQLPNDNQQLVTGNFTLVTDLIARRVISRKTSKTGTIEELRQGEYSPVLVMVKFDDGCLVPLEPENLLFQNGSPLPNFSQATEPPQAESDNSSPDWSTYPHPTSNDIRASINRAQALVDAILAVNNSDQFKAVEAQYSEGEIQWVRDNLLSPRQRQELELLTQREQLRLFN